ncbi:MAG: UDP-N-acetylglucosamine 2-epimerase (non-hydrolyzing) [Flavobacteriales bacterium]|nr:UDP-N-acetylglucosamine 2-epimerase (non-hydrolyzing) [Flavobacteriales bacterium]NNK80815.1 UDP-N-acetylglucosamine 2-epimerase (non-hydrolyzing) [Flavobacteriales bacterium]
MSKKFNLIQIVGARPQIIKSAALSRAVREQYQTKINLETLHTGQHYDMGMSDVFFSKMDIDEPYVNLKIGSGNHAEQTASIMKGCEKEFETIRPEGVLVYGDTNSTLAAALTAYKMNIPVFHVEAGLRSHNLQMPEECNRIAVDHMSTLLFCPTSTSVLNLESEGINKSDGPYSIKSPGIINSGDIMYDNSLYYSTQASDDELFNKLGIGSEEFILATCHRPSNVDDQETFRSILESLSWISSHIAPVVLPLHPRVQKHKDILNQYSTIETLHLADPLDYGAIVQLQINCKLVITDSGGVQKEAFFFRKPCLVLRDETEWMELVDNGNVILCGNAHESIKKGAIELIDRELSFPDFYGDGRSAIRIVDSILDFHSC